MKKKKTFLWAALFTGFFVYAFFPTALLAYRVEIPIGTMDTFTLPEYIVNIHKFGTAIAGILAVVMMMIGGFLWLSSAGNTNQIATGRGFITGAVIGLILVFFSYYILYAINPRLVNLSINAPKKISGGNEEVCCRLNSGDLVKKPTEFECTITNGKVVDIDMEKCSGKLNCSDYKNKPDCNSDAKCIYEDPNVYNYHNPSCKSIDLVPCKEISSETKCKQKDECEWVKVQYSPDYCKDKQKETETE